MKKQSEKQQLNVPIIIETRRADGSLRIQQDFSTCPTMAEQHTAHLTDINYLIDKFKPDELAAYLAARAQHKEVIEGYDFSNEPDFQGARNIAYQLKTAFEELPEDVKIHFKNHLEYLKFIDNPANAEKMIKLGLMTPKQIEKSSTDAVKKINELNDQNQNASPT